MFILEDKEIAAIVERLEKEFPDVPPPEVEAITLEAHDAFNEHPIKTYVPVLVERHAKERLRGRSGAHRTDIAGAQPGREATPLP